MKRNTKTNSRRKVFVVVALNVYSGQRKLSGITRFFNERLPREEDKWNLDILHGHDALTEATMRRAIREGVVGLILLDYPPEATVRLVARSGIPCVVETAGCPDLVHRYPSRWRSNYNIRKIKENRHFVGLFVIT